MQIIAYTTRIALVVIGLLSAYAFTQHGEAQMEAAHRRVHAGWAR
jgi:hypothetical protein